MASTFSKSLFVFRRDLRLVDNTGLLKALEESKEVISCFIFDPRQVEQSNSFGSNNAIQFMLASLAQLNQELAKRKSRLYLFYGLPHEVIKKLIVQEKIDGVYTNRDYTPFSLKRDELIKEVCIKNKAEFIACNDLLLHEPEQIKSGNGDPYSIFTPFYKKASQLLVVQPREIARHNFYNKTIKHSHDKEIFKKILPTFNEHIHVKGGRKEGRALLKKAVANLRNYAQIKDILIENTSNLSAHLKFGTVSIRQTYWAFHKAFGSDHPLLRQLYWRDFFTHIAYQSPFIFGSAYRQKYNNLAWKNDPNDFKAWCQGKTGFPIVDAGMHQLNQTGFMHNRARLIVSSFLVKDLHIDWQWGEKYFAQQLVDYDPAVNNGNWQWAASTGCDAQPYFRIFNPWLQQKKFDPQCLYIKKWIPELKNVDPKIIHTWYKPTSVSINKYPKPILDHTKERGITKKIYKNP